MKSLTAVLLLLVTLVASSVSAQETPVIVNSQTGARVELVRAYWDPNKDIANRVMQCDFFVFNEESQVYEERPDFVQRAPVSPWLRSSPYYHLPLPRVPAQVNTAFVGSQPIDSLGAYLPLWSVADGVYDGIAPMTASEFVEVVAHRSDILNAVRVWHSAVWYHVCYDPNGTPLMPTGLAGINPQLAEPVDDLIVTFESLGDHTGETPALIDRETGLTIEFSTGRWNYNRDIALRSFSCASHRWDDIEGKYLFETWPDNLKTRWYHPYNGGDSILISYKGSDGDLGRTNSFSIEDNIVPWFSSSRRFLEITDRDSIFDFRQWGESNESFIGCSVRLIRSINLFSSESTLTEFGPSLPLENNDVPAIDVSTASSECVYTDAEDYNGWGWNATTSESCLPLISIDPVATAHCIDSDGDGFGWDGAATCIPGSTIPTTNPGTDINCDYSDAELYNGWGWNESTRESCAPVTEMVEQVTADVPTGCDYSNAALSNGWGWNETTRESCAPL